MLTFGLLFIAGWLYYANLAAEDYYKNGGEKPGKWWGKGAEILGLRGIVKRSHLRALFRGFRPGTGEALVQNAGRRDRRAGIDMTFNSPKPASVLVGVSPVTKFEVPRLHDLSVKSALQYFQDNFAFTRVGSVSKGECRLEKADILVAIYEHAVSRASEMHCHSHCLLLNMGVPEDQKTRCLHTKLIFPEKKLLGAWYRAKFAELLRKELRLTCEREEDSFGIRGVPQTLTEANSTRSKEVKAELRKTGEHGGKAAAKACLATRRTKQETESHEKLHEKWRRECRDHGLSPRAFARIQRAKVYDPQKVLPKALARATKNLTRNGGHFSEYDMLYETLLEAPNWGIAPELIPPAVTEYLRTSNKVVRLYTTDHERRYTTESVLKSEKRLLRNVEKLRGRRGPRADSRLVAKMLAKVPGTTAEQIKAVNHLTQSRGSIRLMDGLPGTGKTRFVMKTCCEIWKKQGYRVIGAAPTGKAAFELELGAGIPTDTIHMHLCDFDKKYGFVAKHHLKQLGRAARGKPTYKLKRPKPLHVDKKTIVLVDESGMVNTRHWRMLTELVERGGGTIMGTGDRHQITPVEGSAPFQSICNRLGFAKLTDIRRQQDEWAREAVKLFREGRSGEAFRLYADRGLITVRDDIDKALEALVEDWSRLGVASPELATVLTFTNEQSEAANRLCQQRRIDERALNPRRKAEILDIDKERGTEYRNRVHVGDRVLFTETDRRLKVRNGFLGTVTAISGMGGTITVRLDHGPTLPVQVAKYRHLRLGYAMTTSKFQGGTTEESFVLASMGDRPSIYVQASRAKRKTRFYTTEALMDKNLKNVEDSPLAEQAARAPDLTLAVDLLEEAPATGETPQRKEHDNEQKADDRQLPAFSPVVRQRRKQIQQRWKLRQRVRSRTAADRKRYAMAQEELRRRQFEKAIRMLLPASSPVLRQRRKQRQQPRKLGQRVRTVTPADRQRYAVANNELSRRTLKMATEFLQTGIADLPGSYWSKDTKGLKEWLALEMLRAANEPNTPPGNRAIAIATEHGIEGFFKDSTLDEIAAVIGYVHEAFLGEATLDEVLTGALAPASPQKAEDEVRPPGIIPPMPAPVEPTYRCEDPDSPPWYPGDDFSTGIPSSIHQFDGASFPYSGTGSTGGNSDATSAYTETQLQNIEAAAYQHRGAAQTQATQQNQPATGTQTKPGGGPF